MKNYYIKIWINILSGVLDQMICGVIFRKFYKMTDIQVKKALLDVKLVEKLKHENKQLLEIIKANFFQNPYCSELYYTLIKAQLSQDYILALKYQIDFLILKQYLSIRNHLNMKFKKVPCKYAKKPKSKITIRLPIFKKRNKHFSFKK